MSVCLSVKSHLTSGASVHRKNAATYSAGNEGQKICGVFSETAPLQRSSAPSLGRPYINGPFLLLITHMPIVHMQVLQGSRCDTRAPCRKLSLHSTWLYDDHFEGWRVLVRVVYLAGYRFALGISETVVLL